jgi:hypothetical protein
MLARIEKRSYNWGRMLFLETGSESGRVENG